MSLMLDALKRIEAKHTFARLVSASPARQHATAVAAGVVAAEPIEVPPAFAFDHLADLPQEDIALPGPLSLELALDDLSDLIAEARLLDRPHFLERMSDDYVALLDAPALPDDVQEIDLRAAKPENELPEIQSDEVSAEADAPGVATISLEDVERRETAFSPFEVEFSTPIVLPDTFEVAEDSTVMADDWLPSSIFVPDEPREGDPTPADAETRAELQDEHSASPSASYFGALAEAPIELPAYESEPYNPFDPLGEAANLFFDSIASSHEPPTELPPPFVEYCVPNDAVPDANGDYSVSPAMPPESIGDSLESINEGFPQAATQPEADPDSAPAEFATVAAEQPKDAEFPTVEPVGSDSYATTAWEIFRQLPQGRSQVVLFTSPGDGHGKTTTLARLLPHLARSFAGSVLVIDANTRNPDMARLLDVAATWRLSDVLAGATDWMNAVRPTALPRVSLLPGGTDILRRPNVQATARLFRELTSRYDLVVVDACSLAHQGAAQLAALCDATYLVVRLGASSRRIVRDAVRVVGSVGGRLMGCVAIDAGA